MGNLTQFDLVPGGLYKSGAGWIVRFWPETASMEVLWAPYKIDIGKIIPLRALVDWEGIPITPELLRDWYQAEGNEDMVEIRNKEISISCYTDIDGPSIRFASLTNPSLGGWVFTVNHIHDLQRLVLALTGKPLEGGPK